MKTYQKTGEAANCPLCLKGWGKCAPAHQAAEAVGIEESCDLSWQESGHYHGPHCLTWSLVKGITMMDAKRVHTGCGGTVGTDAYATSDYGPNQSVTATHKCWKCKTRFKQIITNRGDASIVSWEHAH